MEKFVDLDDFELNAERKLDPLVFNYFSSGADDELTLKDNRQAFLKYHINPRVCSGGKADVDLRTEMFGCRLKLPFGFAPSAMQKLAHP